MERDEPSSSKTVTITSPRNGKAKPIRLNNKTKADAYNKVKKRESEMSYSSITDVKGRRVQTTHAVEDKSNKNEQDVADSSSQQNSQSKDQKTRAQQFDRIKSQATYVIPAFLFKDQCAMMFTEGFNMTNRQTTSLFQHLIKKFWEEEISELKSSSENKKHVIFYKILDEKLKTTVFSITNNGGDEPLLVDVHLEIMSMKTWIARYMSERSNKTSGPFYIDVYGKDYDDSGRSSVKTGTNSAVAGVSDQNIGISILLMDTGDKEIQDIQMKLLDSISPHISTIDSLHYLLGGADASDNKLEYIEGKAYDAALLDEFEKSILNVGNDKISKQRSGKKEKIKWLNKVITEKIQLASQLLKEVVQRENYFQIFNFQLTEQEKTELVNQQTELHILKERESEDEEKVKAELPADNIVFHRTKVRNAKSKMNTSSLYCAYNLYRKNVLERVLLSLEQLREALDSLKSPHYIWPSGHPLILSKERQIEPDFSSNEHMKRLHSFVNGANRRHRTWNSDQIVRPEPMVSAGFSYNGEDDKVVCKSCGAISDVNDWSDDDEDYAFTMHRRTGSSHCKFLRKFDPWRSKM